MHCNMLSILLINLLVVLWPMDAMKSDDIQTRYSEIIWSALQVGGLLSAYIDRTQKWESMRGKKKIKYVNKVVKLQCTSWQTN